jgi:hypothetical protein
MNFNAILIFQVLRDQHGKLSGNANFIFRTRIVDPAGSGILGQPGEEKSFSNFSKSKF